MLNLKKRRYVKNLQFMNIYVKIVKVSEGCVTSRSQPIFNLFKSSLLDD